ncbi:MFS transporter [Desulfocurvus sp. DL9XJH121]
MTSEQETMTSPSHAPRAGTGALRGRLVLAALFVLVLAAGFNLLLHLASLEKMLTDSLSDGARVVGADLKANIERSVRYGKRLDKFLGMDDLLRGAVDQLGHQSAGRGREAGHVWRVEIADASGRVLYSTDAARVGRAAAGLAVDAQEPAPFAEERRRVVPLRLRDEAGRPVGFVLAAFSKDAVSGTLWAMARDEVLVGGLVFLGAAVLFWLSLFLVLPRERRRVAVFLKLSRLDPSGGGMAFPRKGLLRAMLLAVVVCQVAYSLYAAVQYKAGLERIVRGKVVAVSTLLREDLEYVLSLGVHLDRLPRIEDAMAGLLRVVPEASAMVVADAAGRELYEARAPGAGVRGMPVRVGLRGPGGTMAGSIVTFVPPGIFSDQIRDVALDSLTILVIAMLFAVELAIMVLDFFQRGPNGGLRSAAYQAVRPAGFLLLFGADSSLSFIPLHMKELAGSVLGLPQELVIALPISVEMFSAGLMIFLSGSWIDRRGWRQPLLTGLAVCVAGFAASWAAPGAFWFLGARALVGLGYGLALMAMQGFIVGHTDDDSRGRGFSLFWAGVYAGSVCGVAAGALVAQQVGYGPVFLFGAAVLGVALAYCATALRGREDAAEARGEERGGRRLGYGRFLASRNVFFTVILANIPAALAIIGLLNYFTPVYLSAAGVSQADIGRVFMLNSLAIILVAQFSGGRIDASRDKRLWVAAAGLLGAASFFFFSFVSGLVAVLGAVVLLGASSSIALTAIGAYVLGLGESRELGQGRATAMVASTYRVGQVLGPVLFGWLASFDAHVAMPLFGGAYLLLSLAVPLALRKVRT